MQLVISLARRARVRIHGVTFKVFYIICAALFPSQAGLPEIAVQTWRRPALTGAGRIGYYAR